MLNYILRPKVSHSNHPRCRLDNAHSLFALTEEARLGSTDVIVHVGDFAYDMYEGAFEFDLLGSAPHPCCVAIRLCVIISDNATVGDEWFNQIQPLAAHVPYMVQLPPRDDFCKF